MPRRRRRRAGAGLALAFAGGLLLGAGARALRRRKTPPEPLPVPTAKLRQVLEHRHVPRLAALLGTALTVSSVRAGFFWDDFILRERLLGAKSTRDVIATMARLFVFVDSETIRPLIDRGLYPWWSAERLKISFFRPLAVGTHVLDHRFWPRSPAAMHFHNVTWYAAACFLAARFFRRIQSPSWVAGLAGVFFALDEAHYMTVSWLSNRNALIALVFGLQSLESFDRWQREGWRAGGVRSLVFLALSLLSAETGVATTAYMACHAAFLGQGSPRRRIQGLLCAAAVALPWWLAYRKAGYGVTASDIYVDPGDEPPRFLRQLPKRALLLVLAQFGWRDVAAYNYSSSAARKKMLLTATAVATTVLGVGWPALRRDATARFFAGGFLLSLVPVCAMQLAGSRLLTFASVGAAGFSSRTLAFHLRAGGPTLGRLGVAALIAGLHLVRAPLRHLERSHSQPFARLQEEQEQFTDVGEAEHQEVIVVNVPNPFAFFYFSAFRSLQGRGSPARLRLLAPGWLRVDIERLDARTILVRPEQGYLVPPGTPGDRSWPDVHPVYLYQQHDRTFRSPSLGFSPGERVELPGMTVEITRVSHDHRALEARIRFAEPLEFPGYRWLRWDWSEMAYRPFTPPPVGERTEVAGMEFSDPDGPWPLF